MALTRGFKETVKDRMERSPTFRRALLREAVECLLSGDVDTGKPSCATTSTARSDSRS